MFLEKERTKHSCLASSTKVHRVTVPRGIAIPSKCLLTTGQSTQHHEALRDEGKAATATWYLDKLTALRLFQYTYQVSPGRLLGDMTTTPPTRFLLPIKVTSLILNGNWGTSLWSQKGFLMCHPSWGVSAWDTSSTQLRIKLSLKASFGNGPHSCFLYSIYPEPHTRFPYCPRPSGKLGQDLLDGW